MTRVESCGRSPQRTRHLWPRRRVVSLRLRLREGPVQLAARVGPAPSAMQQILRRCRINRLAYVDRATGDRCAATNTPRLHDPRRRKEARHPLTVAGGASSGANKATGTRPPPQCWPGLLLGSASAASPSSASSPTTGPPTGRICGATSAPIWASHRNGPALTGPRPTARLNGFHRTLADDWGYARCHTSETERSGQALPGWLSHSHHHRPHSQLARTFALFTRVTSVPGQYS